MDLMSNLKTYKEMKRIISILAAASVFFACADLDETAPVAGPETPSTEEETPSDAPSDTPETVEYTFNVTVDEYAKATKESWEENDKIFVFFDDEATQAATSVENLPYLTLTYTSGEWVADSDALTQTLPEEGTLSAVFCPFGEQALEDGGNGKIWISKSHAYYMQDVDVNFTNIDGTVTFGLKMEMPADYVQLFIPEEGLDPTHTYTLSIRNTEKVKTDVYKFGLQKVFSALYSPADGEVTYSADNVGAAVTGHYYKGGFVFCGFASLGADAKLAFDLRDCTESPQILYSYAITDIDRFEGRMAISLPAISKWTTLTTANNKLTYLYNDGTLVINEDRYTHADNVLVHGGIKKQYANIGNKAWNMWTGSASNQPWNGDKSDISAVEFGSKVAPEGNFRGVFQGCSNLKTINNTNNLDLSAATSLKRAFSDCTVLESIDVSGFNTANVEDMEGLFDNCKAIKSLDVSGWDVSKVTNMCQMFSDCGALTELDLSNWKATSVTNLKEFASIKTPVIDLSGFDTSKCTNMYKMLYYCNKTTTIYVSMSFVMTSVTDSRNMFGNCHSLKGGAGTVYDGSKVDGTYARIDGGTAAPGYFTLKQ